MTSASKLYTSIICVLLSVSTVPPYATLIKWNSLCKLQTAMKAPAHFFKFIRPALNSHLAIPKSFRKYLRNNTIAILSRGDKKWAVTVGDDWVFGDGWDGFMRDNGVQDLDIVIFKHQGNMVFDTTVFTTSWCEREYPKTQVTNSFKKPKVDNNALKISKGKDTNVNRSTKFQVKAEKPMAPDQNHHPKYFLGTLIEYQTSLKLCIPKDFGLANGLGSGEMILKNVENESSWSVTLKHARDRNFYVQQGFPEFCRSIGLEKGDSFRFELIHNGKKPVAVISRLQYPCFRSTVTAHDIKRAYMNIPLPFARVNKLYPRNCQMFVMDEKQRRWQIQLCNSKTHASISRLRPMMVANGLKVADEISLELVDNGNPPLMNFYRHGSSSHPGSL